MVSWIKIYIMNNVYNRYSLLYPFICIATKREPIPTQYTIPYQEIELMNRSTIFEMYSNAVSLLSALADQNFQNIPNNYSYSSNRPNVCQN